MNLVQRVSDASKYRRMHLLRLEQRFGDLGPKVYEQFWNISRTINGSLLDQAGDADRFATLFAHRSYRCYQQTERELSFYGK